MTSHFQNPSHRAARQCFLYYEFWQKELFYDLVIARRSLVVVHRKIRWQSRTMYVHRTSTTTWWFSTGFILTGSDPHKNTWWVGESDRVIFWTQSQPYVRASIFPVHENWIWSINLTDVCRFGTFKFSPIQLCRKVHTNFQHFWVCSWEPYLCRIWVKGTEQYSTLQILVQKNQHFWVRHWKPYLCRICVQIVLSNILHKTNFGTKKTSFLGLSLGTIFV